MRSDIVLLQQMPLIFHFSSSVAHSCCIVMIILSETNKRVPAPLGIYLSVECLPPKHDAKVTPKATAKKTEDQICVLQIGKWCPNYALSAI